LQDLAAALQEGTGIAKLIPHVAPDCVDLIIKLLAYNPDDRLR
jgi:renal tumor antigen